MTNLLRVEEPGLVIHASANAVDGHPLLRDDDDRVRYFELLAEEVERSKWTILSWCFMTTHVHLLLRLEKRSLSSGFHRLQSRYAKAYNRRYRRRGVVWQRRFHTSLVHTDWHLFEAVRYIALNPVRAKMVDAPEDWAWSSYGSLIGVYWEDALVDEDALLGLFARNRAIARSRLREFVEEKDLRERWRQTNVRRPSDGKQ